MTKPGIWLVAVGCVLAAVAVVGWFWSESVLPPAVFTGEAVACIVLGLVLARRAIVERARAIPDLSYSIIALGIGGAMMLNGIVLGRWLLYIGAGLTTFGLGGLVREQLAARRALR
jgi:hypothetical protein